jgi:hypothetical protein
MGKEEDYRRALDAARKDLTKVLQDRTELDQRASELKKTIEGLSALCDEEDYSTGLPEGATLADVGISNAIRVVLRDTSDPALTPTEIRDELEKRGLNLSEYASEMAVIHNTLARLERQGEVIKLTNRDGVPYAYAIRTGKFVRRVREDLANTLKKAAQKADSSA